MSTVDIIEPTKPQVGRQIFSVWRFRHLFYYFTMSSIRRYYADTLLGWVKEQGQPLLLATDDAGWDIALPDLKSRLGAALHLSIEAPDDEMLASLIESHAGQRGLALGEGALTYLVPRATRSFADIEHLVEEIDRLSLERKVPATLAIWRAGLEAVQGPEQARLL